MAKRRESNLELLRIVSIVLIVLHHCLFHGYGFDNFKLSENKWALDFLLFGGGGINCFVLISGYFMVKSRFTIRKLLNLWGSVWFYSVLFLLLFLTVLLPAQEITRYRIICYLLPVSWGQYWFITAYIQLMALSFFLNAFINKCGRKMLGFAIIAGVVLVFCFMVSYAGELDRFILLYLIGAYIRLYNPLRSWGSRRFFLLAAGMLAILAGCAYLFNWIANELEIGQYGIAPLCNIIYRITGKATAYVTVLSVVVFMGFARMRIGRSKSVNYLAASALGVYLIHDNPLVRPWLWGNVLGIAEHAKASCLQFSLYCVASVILVYVCCTAIDCVRRATVEKAYMRLIDRWALPRIERALAWLKRKLGAWKASAHFPC